MKGAIKSILCHRQAPLKYRMVMWGEGDRGSPEKFWMGGLDGSIPDSFGWLRLTSSSHELSACTKLYRPIFSSITNIRDRPWAPQFASH